MLICHNFLFTKCANITFYLRKLETILLPKRNYRLMFDRQMKKCLSNNNTFVKSVILSILLRIWSYILISGYFANTTITFGINFPAFFRAYPWSICQCWERNSQSRGDIYSEIHVNLVLCPSMWGNNAWNKRLYIKSWLSDASQKYVPYISDKRTFSLFGIIWKLQIYLFICEDTCVCVWDVYTKYVHILF